MLDNLLWQPLSRSSLVFLMVLHPLLHTPCISSPSRHLLFAAHTHINAACSAVIPMLCHLYLVSLSSLLGNLSFSLMPHIHLTILISARWNATTFSFLRGHVSLPCNMLLRILAHCTTNSVIQHKPGLAEGWPLGWSITHPDPSAAALCCKCIHRCKFYQFTKQLSDKSFN